MSWAEGLCEDQDLLWPGMVLTEPLGLCGHLSCLQGKVEYPWGLTDICISSIMASGQYLTESSCHLLSWDWSWEPRPSQESQDCWGNLLICMQLILSWKCGEIADKLQSALCPIMP